VNIPLISYRRSLQIIARLVGKSNIKIGVIFFIAVLSASFLSGCTNIAILNAEQIEKVDLRRFVPQNDASIVTRFNGYKIDMYHDTYRI
jgi:hypothetical protein